MQNYQLDIRIVGDDHIQIKFKASSCVSYEFFCHTSDLVKYNLKNVEELSITIIRQMIKTPAFDVTKTINYDSSVIYFENNKKTLSFQIEDGLAMVTKKDTQEEVFFSIQDKTIDQLRQFNLRNFNSLKKKRKKITPLSTRIETSESNFGF